MGNSTGFLNSPAQEDGAVAFLGRKYAKCVAKLVPRRKELCESRCCGSPSVGRNKRHAISPSGCSDSKVCFGSKADLTAYRLRPRIAHFRVAEVLADYAWSVIVKGLACLDLILILEINRESPVSDNIGHSSPFLVSLATRVLPERIDLLLESGDGCVVNGGLAATSRIRRGDSFRPGRAIRQRTGAACVANTAWRSA